MYKLLLLLLLLPFTPKAQDYKQLDISEQEVKSFMISHTNARFDGKKYNEAGDPYLVYSHYINRNTNSFDLGSRINSSVFYFYDTGICGMVLTTHNKKYLTEYMDSFINNKSLLKVSGFKWITDTYSVEITKSQEETFFIIYKPIK